MNRIVQFNTYLYLWQKKKHMKAKVCLRELKAGSQCLITEVHLARVIKSLKCLSVISTELLGVTFN